jgi:hypothetical protein
MLSVPLDLKPRRRPGGNPRPARSRSRTTARACIHTATTKAFNPRRAGMRILLLGLKATVQDQTAREQQEATSGVPRSSRRVAVRRRAPAGEGKNNLFSWAQSWVFALHGNQNRPKRLPKALAKATGSAALIAHLFFSFPATGVGRRRPPRQPPQQTVARSCRSTGRRRRVRGSRQLAARRSSAGRCRGRTHARPPGRPHEHNGGARRRHCDEQTRGVRGGSHLEAPNLAHHDGGVYDDQQPLFSPNHHIS